MIFDWMNWVCKFNSDHNYTKLSFWVLHWTFARTPRLLCSGAPVSYATWQKLNQMFRNHWTMPCIGMQVNWQENCARCCCCCIKLFQDNFTKLIEIHGYAFWFVLFRAKCAYFTGQFKCISESDEVNWLKIRKISIAGIVRMQMYTTEQSANYGHADIINRIHNASIVYTHSVDGNILTNLAIPFGQLADRLCFPFARSNWMWSQRDFVVLPEIITEMTMPMTAKQTR